ncbi:unnamed protein product [Prunus armeniaca]
MKKLPESVGQLCNLQTLDISDTEIETLPKEIAQLRRKHIKLVGNLTQLTHIGITNVEGSNEMNLCASMQPVFIGPPPHLQRFLLSGKLATVPSWFASFRSLTNISLRWSRLKEDLLPHIEALPCLRRLILVNAYVGNELCFKIGFAKLTHLELLNFSFLKNITIKEGVMPKLRLLVLHCCMNLKALPHGLEFLQSLETLRLGSVPMKIIENIREGGVDHPKVQHIREIDQIYETSSATSSAR